MKYLIKFLLFLIFSLSINLSLSQIPFVDFEQTYGGTGEDVLNIMILTNDGGYLLGGYTRSNNGDIQSGNNGGQDFWVVKTNSAGILEWEQTYGGSGNDILKSIKSTVEGGFILAGYTFSNNGDVQSGNHGGMDYWVIKINNLGIIEWEQTYGGDLQDYLYSIEIASDGGYLLGGYTRSNNGDIQSGLHGGYDMWVVKINNTGNIEWERTYGGSKEELLHSTTTTSDGGYMLCGYSGSTDGDVQSGINGNDDYWVVKINNLGSIDWEQTYGGSSWDFAYDITSSSDGGYVIGGRSSSDDGDIQSGNHGGMDYWVIKINNLGIKEWEQTYGGTLRDYLFTIINDTDGGYILGGYTLSNDEDIQSGNHGAEDFWIVKISSNGSIVWEQTYGGSNEDVLYSMVSNSNGEYTIGGYSLSNDGDIQTGNQGNEDFWIIKIYNDYIIWNGFFDTDWNTESNWSGNLIPTQNDNILIPNVINHPVISFNQTASCNKITINSNASLTINSGGSLITNGTINNNGIINIEKEISKTQWHYISSPINTETSNIFFGEYLQRWDETIGEWVEITSTNELLEAGKGYALFVQNAKENQQYTFIGTPNTGDVVRTISYHDNFTDPINGHDGANLLGNPYPSSIDWNATSGLGAVYCWDGNNGYVAYPETGDYGTGSRYIAPMQGFFIVVPDNDPSSFTFTNSMRTHEGATNYYKNNKRELSNGIVLGTGDTNSQDLLIVRQNIDAQVSFEHDKDALKFFSNTEGKSELWSEADNEKLSIDIRADISEIPLGFKNSINGSYSIYLDEIADISSVNIYDHKTDVNHDLLSSPFNFDWDKSDSYNRFTLFINATGIEEASDNDFNVYYYNGCIFIIGDQMDKFESIGIYDINGKLVSYHSDIDTGRVPINSDLSHGLYLVKFMSSDVNITKKIIL